MSDCGCRKKSRHHSKKCEKCYKCVTKCKCRRSRCGRRRCHKKTKCHRTSCHH